MTTSYANEGPSTILVGDRPVGTGSPCLVIGEVGLVHDGSLGAAHAYVDAIADAGADAAKFQTHIAEAESTDHEPWRTPFSYQDERRYDYWKRTSFTSSQWTELAAHCRERGLLFLSSPFSRAAVELLAGIGMPAWKVASGEVTNLLLLEAILQTGGPVMLSSGMSTLRELEVAANRVHQAGARLCILQCTTEYPTPPERVGLNLLAELRDRFGCPVGLSDHSGTPAMGIAAVALGANLLEVHVTFHRSSFGPDVSSSLTVEELATLVEGVRAVETALDNPVDKDARAAELEQLRSSFGQSLVAATGLPAGAVLRAKSLDARKPRLGITTSRYDEVLGRRLARPVAAGAFLQDDDLEPESEKP